MFQFAYVFYNRNVTVKSAILHLRGKGKDKIAIEMKM